MIYPDVMFFGARFDMVTPEQALPGRPSAIPTSSTHLVLDTPIHGPWPAHFEVIGCAMGCFWGVEKAFWELPGVYTTAAGYAGGFTPNPTYEEVCSGKTGHTEVVLVVYDPTVCSTNKILALFWEDHDPTQGMAQGNDMGTQYRSALFTTTRTQHDVAVSSREAFQPLLHAHRYGDITTEIVDVSTADPHDVNPWFFYAEDYHQQYLHRNPNGYCPMLATGIQHTPLREGYLQVNSRDASDTLNGHKATDNLNGSDATESPVRGGDGD